MIEYRTTRMAIQWVAMWEPWDNCWEIILPHPTDYKVKLEDGEPMAGVAAEFTRWCRENNLRCHTGGRTRPTLPPVYRTGRVFPFQRIFESESVVLLMCLCHH